MKLLSISINIETGIVTCQCVLVVQDNPVFVPISIPEVQLYDAAFTRGEQTWENEDVCLVAGQISGQEVTI